MGNKLGVYWGVGALLLSSCSGNTVFSKPSFLASSSSTVGTIKVSPSPTPSPQPSSSPSSVASPQPSPSSSTVVSSGGVATCGSNNITSAASFFPCSAYFNQNIANAPLDPNSATIISNLQWGRGPLPGGILPGASSTMRITTGFSVYYANSAANRMTFVNPLAGAPFYGSGVYTPDSDILKTVPVYPGNSSDPNYNVGFETGSRAVDLNVDNHFMAMDVSNNMLVEGYQVDASTGVFASNASLLFWPTASNYWAPNYVRGDYCTSADAAGLPMAPLIITPDEVASGVINHAIRLILQNSNIAYGTYVRPATHYTGGNGWASASTGVPYGARLRLKASYVLPNASPGAQVIVTAMKQYGLILADGGADAFEFATDQYSTTKWGTLLTSTLNQNEDGYVQGQDLAEYWDLAAIPPSAFDMIAPDVSTSAAEIAANGSNHRFSNTDSASIAGCTRTSTPSVFLPFLQ